MNTKLLKILMMKIEKNGSTVQLIMVQ